MKACAEALHDLSERGHTGLVVGIRSLPESPAHAYVVAFEPPLPTWRGVGPEMPLPVRHYAADELEFIDPPR
jgi:hypothetical protein